MLEGSEYFQLLSDVFEQRDKLYQANSITIKFYFFWGMIKKRAYWGEEFYSLGLLSFFKDLCFCFNLIPGSVKDMKQMM